MGDLSSTSHAYVPMGAYNNGKVTFWDNYSRVVNWISVRGMLTTSILQKFHTKSVDFVLAYTQADGEPEIYMEVSLGFGVDEGQSRELFIWMDKNLYGLKDDGLYLL